MPADPNTYLAEERTFLAWIRTGIAMMGFGFVVARFGLFLRELSSIRSLPQFQTSALSVPLGTALLVAGVLVNIRRLSATCASSAR
jgi:putative membrane protein